MGSNDDPENFQNFSKFWNSAVLVMVVEGRLASPCLVLFLHYYGKLAHVDISVLWIVHSNDCYSRPRGLRRRTAASRLLGLWDRIPPWTWSVVCCHVEICGTGRSLVQRSISEYGVYWVWSGARENALHLQWVCRQRSDRQNITVTAAECRSVLRLSYRLKQLRYLLRYCWSSYTFRQFIYLFQDIVTCQSSFCRRHIYGSCNTTSKSQAISFFSLWLRSSIVKIVDRSND